MMGQSLLPPNFSTKSPQFPVPVRWYLHDDVIHFPRYWPLWGEPIGNRWIPLTKARWRRTLTLSLICAWTNGWASNRDTGDLRRHCAHYDVTVMFMTMSPLSLWFPLLVRQNLYENDLLIPIISCTDKTASLSSPRFPILVSTFMTMPFYLFITTIILYW